MAEVQGASGSGALISSAEILGLRRILRPVDEDQWAKLRDLDSALRLIEGRQGLSPEDERRIEVCRENLKLAKACIERGAKRRASGRPDLFWQLIHETAMELLLLYPEERLEAEAVEVLEQFRRNILDETARAAWLGSQGKAGPLVEAVQRIGELTRKPPPRPPEQEAQLRQDRYVLRGALALVNAHTDTHFRQLAFTLLIQCLSGALLLVLFVLAWLFARWTWFPEWRLMDVSTPLGVGVLSLVMLGAGGAILANMTAARPVLLMSGRVRRHLVYYLLVKPTLGGFAAFLFFLLARSQMLFSIQSAGGGLLQPAAGELPPAIRMVLTSRLAVEYAYALLAVAFGFSADKVLGSTMDKVLSKLFSVAEKGTATAPGAQPPKPPG